ncbi:MAG: mandelate racemase/muconate lactonizing enzyme family protein [Roseiflexaceae bacterium]
MNITQIETLCLSRMHEPERQWFTHRYRTIKADCAIVVIHTDASVTGIGEACAYGVPTRIREWVAWLAPALIGRDPCDPTIVPHPNGRTRAFDCAVGGIDCALWDLRGKLAGKRVCELLADRPAAQVRLYASGGCRYDWRTNPAALIVEVQGYIAAGYTACKVRIGTEWAWDGVTVDQFLGLMRELAQTAAGRIELMLDGNQRLTFDQALTIAQELDRLGFIWFEEPIPMADIDGYAKLNAAVDLPITGGEQLTTLEQFRPYLEQHAYSVVQPDAGVCGISETMRIAAAAARYGVGFCPHSWHNGLMAMANAHVVAAQPTPRVLEVCMHQGPLQWGILAEPPTLQNGQLVLPERPGLGVELAEAVAERFPLIEGHYAIEVER